MSKRLIPALIAAAVLVAAAVPVPAAETKAEHDARMQWWREARFGLFIHWGLYAVPAGEWGGKTSYGEWIRNNAQIPLEVYDKFVPRFNPVKFDAEAWVRTAKDAGMKYIVITSKHHDGFAIFDSKVSDFDIMATPFKRDILKELATACRKYGMKLCFYHSIMDWHHPDYFPRRPWEEKTRPALAGDFEKYVLYMKAQLKELLTNYGDIGVLWFDGEWEATWTEERGRDLYQYVRSLQPSIIINNRVGASRSGMEGFSESKDSAGDFGTPEQQIPATGLPGLDWETCMTMNDNWGYNKADANWKSSRDLIRMLADIASKGGNFLLNVGPTAEGVFPGPSLERLAAIGRWMKVNGEAIYGTSASPFKSLSFGRATQKAAGAGTRIYLHVFDWPKDGRLFVPGLLSPAKNAFLLADPAKKTLKIDMLENGLAIAVPAAPDADDSVVVLDISGKPDVAEPPRISAGSGIFTDALDVEIASDRENVEIRYTLDGTAPTAQSPVVAGPIRLTRTALVTAACFRKERSVSGPASMKFEKVVPRPGVAVDRPILGLIYSVFAGEWDTLPDFGKMKPSSSDMTLKFDIASIVAAKEKYGVEFRGFLRVPQDGVYTFFVSSDDGSRLWIGDAPVVDNDGLHGMIVRKGEVALASGYHPVLVRYFNKTGDRGLIVEWQVPGGKKEAIPETVLFHK